MTIIASSDYQKNYEALAKEPVVRAMARDIVVDLITDPGKLPFKLVHPDGTPTFEFMQAALAGYARAREGGLASTEAESIGAVAHAILIVARNINALLEG